MKRIFYYVILILIGGNGMMMAQNGLIHGRVTDMENNPVDGVAVVLQTLDSVYVDAVVTDSLGSFNLDHVAEQTCGFYSNIYYMNHSSWRYPGKMSELSG